MTDWNRSGTELLADLFTPKLPEPQVKLFDDRRWVLRTPAANRAARRRMMAVVKRMERQALRRVHRELRAAREADGIAPWRVEYLEDVPGGTWTFSDPAAAEGIPLTDAPDNIEAQMVDTGVRLMGTVK